MDTCINIELSMSSKPLSHYTVFDKSMSRFINVANRTDPFSTRLYGLYILIKWELSVVARQSNVFLAIVIWCHQEIF